MSLRTLKDGKQVLALPASWNERFRVTVVGCGGTGSEMVDALMRLHHVLLHFGHPHGIELELIDADTVSPANVGRQRFLPSDVGQNKAQVLARRYGLLYDAPITAQPRDCDERDFPRLAMTTQLLITCVDRAAYRLTLGRWGTRRHNGHGPDGCYWFDLGNGSHTGQCVLGSLDTSGRVAGPFLPNVHTLFGVDLERVDDHDEPSCSLEAALAAQRLGINRLLVDAAIFTVLSPLFTQGAVDVHGTFVDLAKGTVRPLRIGGESWGFFGYTPPVITPASAD